MAVYQSYTLAQLQAQLAERADESPFWTPAEAQGALNEALLVWNSLTGFWKDTVDVKTTATNWDYAVPEGLVFGTRVLFNGRVLGEASLGDMDYGKPGWQSQTTASGGSVPTAPKLWLPMSIDLIAIWPADAAGGNTLTIDGVCNTPVLQDAGDYIDIGNDELSVILGYALHAMALKEGGDRFAASMPYFIDFLKAAAEENDQLNLSSEFRNFIGTDMNRETRITRGSSNPYDELSGRKP